MYLESAWNSVEETGSATNLKSAKTLNIMQDWLVSAYSKSAWLKPFAGAARNERIYLAYVIEILIGRYSSIYFSKFATNTG